MIIESKPLLVLVKNGLRALIIQYENHRENVLDIGNPNNENMENIDNRIQESEMIIEGINRELTLKH